MLVVDDDSAPRAAEASASRRRSEPRSGLGALGEPALGSAGEGDEREHDRDLDEHPDHRGERGAGGEAEKADSDGPRLGNDGLGPKKNRTRVDTLARFPSSVVDWLRLLDSNQRPSG